ncbi:nitric oxide reductase transcriptional regulator NorR [Parapedomonas caeni]
MTSHDVQLITLLDAGAVVLREVAAGQEGQAWHAWLQQLRRATGCDACALLRLAGRELAPLAIAGLSPDTLGRRFPLDQHPRLQAIVASAEPIRFPADSPLPDPFDGLIPDLRDRLHVHDCAGIALRDGDRVVGALTLDALQAGVLRGEALAVLRAAAGFAGACLGLVERQSRLAESVERQHQVSSALLAELRPDDRLIGRSPAMKALLQDIDTVAGSDLTVLITGETGAGKELVARAVHYRSNRADKPLIHVNCAALPETLAESELFGHVAGAFSGASGHRRGRFEIADGGTLFLDEVGELPLAVQAKLLRALQSGEVQRVGEDRHIEVDTRIVAATNRDLVAEVRAGRFRADLYHRLSVYPVHVPPLRERGRDVLLLAGHMLELNRAVLRLRGLRLTPQAQAALLAHDWPGNVRELEHMIGRAALKAAAGGRGADRVVTIDVRHLDLPSPADAGAVLATPAVEARAAGVSLAAATDAFQRQLIDDMLVAHRGNLAAAARALGMDRGNLHRLARRLGLRSSGH